MRLERGSNQRDAFESEIEGASSMFTPILFNELPLCRVSPALSVDPNLYGYLTWFSEMLSLWWKTLVGEVSFELFRYLP